VGYSNSPVGVSSIESSLREPLRSVTSHWVSETNASRFGFDRNMASTRCMPPAGTSSTASWWRQLGKPERPVVAVIMATIGLASFLQGMAPFFWGVETKNLPLPVPDVPLFLGPILLSPLDLIAAATALLSIGLIGWFFTKSRTGIALRAIADDQQVSLAMGIDVKRYFAVAWGIAGAVALIGGLVWGNLLGVNAQLALVGLKVFPVVILGGLDSIVGAIVGGLIVGVVESLAAGFIDPYVGGGTKDFTPYVLMVLVLMIRPYGLFGKVDIERV